MNTAQGTRYNISLGPRKCGRGRRSIRWRRRKLMRRGRAEGSRRRT